MKKSLLFWIIIGVFFAGCEPDRRDASQKTKQSPRIRKSIELTAPGINSEIKTGESITFSIKHKDPTGRIDSAFLLFDNQKIRFENNRSIWKSSNQIGRYNFQILAYTAGTNESLHPTVTILPSTPPVEYSYRILKSFPHDEGAWTQGLFFSDKVLYESTGQNGESSLRKVNLLSGEVIQSTNLEDEYFGEGSTLWNNNIYWLTWTGRVGFVYDQSLKRTQSFNYTTEGWGITTKGDTLIMSDGTENLYFMRPEDFSLIKTVQVYDHRGKVDELNELEFIDGLIYANVWGEDKIVIIDPSTGIVVGTCLFNGIYTGYRANRYDKSMNGIAVDADGRIFVTGKYWPELHEISLSPKNNNL